MTFLIIFIALIVIIYTIDYCLIDNKTNYLERVFRGIVPFWNNAGHSVTPEDIYYRFERILIYIKIIYNSLDFDHEYATNLFLFQLKRLSNCIETNNRHTNSKHYSKRINLAVKLIEMGYSEHYRNELDKIYPTKMSTSIYNKNENFLELNFIPTSNKGKAPWSEVKKARNKDQKAIKLGFDIIGKDIQHWWS